MASVRRGTTWGQLARLFAVALVMLLSAEAKAEDNILILNSYHRGKLLSDETIDAIVAELRKKHPELTFLIEDMDTKRRSLEVVRSPLLSLYTVSYTHLTLPTICSV